MTLPAAATLALSTAAPALAQEGGQAAGTNPARAAESSQPVSGGLQYGDVNARGQRLEYIRNASDLDHLDKYSVGQGVIDLSRNPILSNDTRRELSAFLDSYNYDDSDGQMVVVVVPDAPRDLSDLSTGLINQMGIGDAYEDNGVLLLANASVLNMGETRGSMILSLGDGVDGRFTNQAATDLLIEHALPHLHVGDFDSAVKAVVYETVDRMQYYEANPEFATTRDTVDSPVGRELRGEDVDWQNAGMTALAVLGGLIGMGALGAGGVTIHRIQRRRGEAAEVVNKALGEKNSAYKAGKMNVYKVKTAEALLTPTSKEARPESMMPALQILEEAVHEKERGKLRKLYLEQGISYPLPEVRKFSIGALKPDAGSRGELFKAFMAQLAREDDQSVIDALQKPLTNMATEKDLPEFNEGLDSDHDGIRQISASVLGRFFKPETMGKFFDRLAVEDDADVIGVIQEQIIAHADESFAKLFMEKLAHEHDNVRMSAIDALGKLAGEKYFTPVYDAFDAEKADTLDQHYTGSLKAITEANHDKVAGNHLERLYQGLDNKPSKRHQALAISLLGTLGLSGAVAKLFEYIGHGESKLPEPAADVLVASSAKENNTLLLEKVADGHAFTRLSAARALAKLALKENVPALFDNLEAEADGKVAAKLDEAINNSDLSSNPLHQLLREKTGSGNSNVRLASARGLAGLGRTGDLVLLMDMLAKEKDKSAAAQAHQGVVRCGGNNDAFGALTKALPGYDSVAVKHAVIEALKVHNGKALDPLFEELSKAGTSTPQGLVTALQTAIREIGGRTDCLNYMLDKANGRNTLVVDTAADVASDRIYDWREQYSYDDHGAMDKLSAYSRHRNDKISSTASSVYKGFVQDKLNVVDQYDDFSNSTYTSDVNKLRQIANNAYESKVRTAAENGISRLKREKSAYDAAQARIAAERAAAAAAARQAAARAASSSSTRSIGGGGSASGRGGGLGMSTVRAFLVNNGLHWLRKGVEEVDVDAADPSILETEEEIPSRQEQ